MKMLVQHTLGDVPTGSGFVARMTSKALALAAFCLIVHVPLLDAATYYVSSSQGDDNNSGTSVDTPWKTFRNVYMKGITASKYAPGDSILLKAGDAFNGPLKIINPGADGSPITVGRYGTGPNPIIYGDHPSILWSALDGYPGIYSATPVTGSSVVRVYDLNGRLYDQRSKGTDSIATWLSKFMPNDWGFDASTGLFYVCTPDGNAPPPLHLFEWAAVHATQDYITFEHLDVRSSNMGIAVTGAKGVVSRNNTVQDTLFMGIYYGSGASFGEIATNTVTRTGETSIYLQTGGSHWVHHNTCSYAGGTSEGVTILGIALAPREQCGIGLERGTNNIVEYNSISRVYGSFFDYWLEVRTAVRFNYGFRSGGAAYPHGTGLRLHNNFFNLDGQGPGIGGAHAYDSSKSPAPDAGENLIYNNVVYNFKNYGLFSATNASSNVRFRNNILVATSSTPILVVFSTGIDADYNYYHCTVGPPRGWNWNGITHTTLAAFRAASGQEFNAIYAPPQFVSDNPITAADFMLKGNSPCINAGQDLKAAGFLPPTQEYRDYLGIPIPQGLGADIGPYEIREVAPASELRIIDTKP